MSRPRRESLSYERGGVRPLGMERMLGLGFEDVIAGHRHLDGASAVAITVGRTDWTAFPWAEHPDAWSPWVRETGRDYVAETIAAAGDRRITLLVDVMVEGWIARDPAIAGVDAAGIRSTEFASVAALAGIVGDRIVALVGAAAVYGPAAVTLTELFLDRWTFGDDDLALYLAFSGGEDWPRDAGGGVDQRHPSIGAWRCAAVTDLVARCASAARGVGLEVEVRAQWDGPHQRDGQDYAALLDVADRLVIWGYFALHEREPESLELLARQAPAGSTISIGLWAPSGVISPDELRRAADAVARGGAHTVEVVPMSLMTEGHWAALGW